ncbi:hypothetical protein AB6A40_002572 [Gnathostoma spinigerum]|uniref:Uncharacterized protein n=1 Tax=Gnathostoma spinigerum TaxID=75299 RepID=A0ABD6E6Y6_9BILA
MFMLGFDVPIVLIVLIALLSYLLIVLILFAFCYRFQPQKLEQLEVEDVTQVSDASLPDCSMFLHWCPCADCSPRATLKNVCPSRQSVHRILLCECVRPQLDDNESVHGFNLVCCSVGDRR